MDPLPSPLPNDEPTPFVNIVFVYSFELFVTSDYLRPTIRIVN